MSVKYGYYTGHPAHVFPQLSRYIRDFVRRKGVKGYKIGISGNPGRRWHNGYRGEYDKMFVLYGTSSTKHLDRMERELIDHNWNIDFCHNQRGGGGGPKSLTEYHYLYLVARY